MYLVSPGGPAVMATWIPPVFPLGGDGHMEFILFPQGAVMIARYMKLQRGTIMHWYIVVGWESTAQLTSLSQLYSIVMIKASSTHTKST